METVHGTAWEIWFIGAMIVGSGLAAGVVGGDGFGPEKWTCEERAGGKDE